MNIKLLNILDTYIIQNYIQNFKLFILSIIHFIKTI